MNEVRCFRQVLEWSDGKKNTVWSQTIDDRIGEDLVRQLSIDLAFQNPDNEKPDVTLKPVSAAEKIDCNRLPAKRLSSPRKCEAVPGFMVVAIDDGT